MNKFGLKQITFEDPLLLRKLNRQIPAELETIIEKSIRKNPTDRYTTAAELADDLRNFLASKPIKARAPTWREQFSKWSHRHPAAVRATAISGLVTLAVIAASLGWISRDRATRQAVLNQQVRQAIEETETWYKAGKWTNAMSSVKRAEGFLATGGNAEQQQQVNQWRSDLETVETLDRIRLDRAGTDQEKGSFADRTYGEVFRKYGFELRAPDIEECSRRIRASRIKEELIVSLDDWYQSESVDVAAESKIPTEKNALLQVARLADPDPWRIHVREAIEHNDLDAMQALAKSQEILAQPPATLLLFMRADTTQ